MAETIPPEPDQHWADEEIPIDYSDRRVVAALTVGALIVMMGASQFDPRIAEAAEVGLGCLSIGALVMLGLLWVVGHGDKQEDDTDHGNDETLLD